MSPRRIRSLEYSIDDIPCTRRLCEIVLMMGMVIANSFSSVECVFSTRPSTSGMQVMSKYTLISSIRSRPHICSLILLGLSSTPKHFTNNSASS